LAVGDIGVEMCINAEERMQDSWIKGLTVEMQGTIHVEGDDFFDC
jgi:hypothetical protein